MLVEIAGKWQNNPMHTMRPEFCEAFVKQCFDNGLSEELTLDMFRQTHMAELLEKDADFRAGWDEEFHKAALGLKTTLGLGALAAGGAGAWLKEKHPDAASFIPGLQPPSESVAAPVGTGLGALAGLKLGMKGLGKVGPWWAKGLALAGSTAIGAVGGRALGKHVSTPDLPPGAGAAGPFLPEALQPALDQPSTRPNPQSLLSVPGAGLVNPDLNSSGGAAGKGLTMGAQTIQDANKQVQSLNTALESAHAQASKALSTPGIQGSSQAMEIQRRIQDLERQKAEILTNSNSFMGEMRRQQGQSFRSIDRATAQSLAARSARQPRADLMDNWIRSHPNNNFLYRLFNHLTGAEGQVAQMSSQMRNLDGSIKTLGENRTRVQNMLLPGT